MNEQLTLQQTDDASDFTVECTIVFKYWALIPGMSPPRWGVHWLFEQDSLAVNKAPRYMNGGNLANDADLLLQSGFWTLQSTADERLRAEVGTRVLAHLVLRDGNDGLPYLMPVPNSDFGIVDSSTGKSLFRPNVDLTCPTLGLAGGYPPLTIAFGQLSSMARYADDLWWAAEQWNTRTGSQFSIWPVITNPTYTHYSVGFAGSNHLAETQIDVNGRRPNPTDQFQMIFNANREWSEPGASPTGGQFDFRSVVLHEMGHAMGLDHLDGNPLNVMRYGHARGEVRRQLQPDDIRCMRELCGT